MTKPCSSSTWRRRFLRPSVEGHCAECFLSASSITRRSRSGFACSIRRAMSGSRDHSTRRSARKRSKAGGACIMPSFDQWLAFDRAAPQQPVLLGRKPGPRVDGAAIVPHQDIAELPHMLVNELAPLAELVELFEDRVAFGAAHALDPRGHQTV